MLNHKLLKGYHKLENFANLKLNISAIYGSTLAPNFGTCFNKLRSIRVWCFSLFCTPIWFNFERKFLTMYIWLKIWNWILFRNIKKSLLSTEKRRNLNKNRGGQNILNKAKNLKPKSFQECQKIISEHEKL